MFAESELRVQRQGSEITACTAKIHREKNTQNFFCFVFFAQTCSLSQCKRKVDPIFQGGRMILRIFFPYQTHPFPRTVFQFHIAGMFYSLSFLVYLTYGSLECMSVVQSFVLIIKSRLMHDFKKRSINWPLFLIRVNAGVYPSIYWVRDRSATWTGHQV